ncbi:MAG: ribonuclease P protein component [Porticoccaceae bacterium]|nr:ribonuclease P protein component [Porticoccaceae bacterium]
MPKETFGKNKRLLTQRIFQQVFDKAPFRVSHRNFLVLARPNELGRARLGLIIGKKNIGLAVNRNRVKRQARETFRHQHRDLPAIDVIFLARRGLDDPNTNITEILNKAWIKLGHDAREI